MHQDNLAYHSYAVVWVLNCSDNNNAVDFCISLKLLQMFLHH